MAVSVFKYPQVLHLTLSSIMPNCQRTGTYMHVSQHYTQSLIKLFRNTDQRVDLLLKDWDKRPIKFEEYEQVWFKLFDGVKEVMEVEAELLNFDRGHYIVEFDRADTGLLPLGREYSWCIIVKDTQADTVRQLFTDLTYGAAAPLHVLEGPLPAEPEALNFDLETLTAMGEDGWVTSALVGGAQLINPNGVHSIVLNTQEFAGIITVEGSLDSELSMTPGNWFNILTEDFTAEGDAITGTHHIGFAGQYNWFRLKFSTTVGLGTMTYRNA